jgi:hypothetical protein
MTKIKALSAVVILSAAIATPVFSQDAIGPRSHRGLEPQPWPHRTRDCIQGPGSGPCPGPLMLWSLGRDRSRVGGLAPSLRPSGS